MFNPKNHGSEFNFWPSIADTLLAIFMVFLMLWLAEKLIFLQELEQVKTGNQILTQQFTKSEENNEALTQQFAKSAESLEDAQKTIAEIKQNAQRAMLGWQRCEGEKQVCEREKQQCEREKQWCKEIRQEKENLRKEHAKLGADLQACQQQHTQNQTAEQKIQDLLRQCQSSQIRYTHDKPPIITLSELETEEFSFPTGNAVLSSEFQAALAGKVEKLVKIKNQYGVDVIEVIGHTDGEITQRVRSNLDIELENTVKSRDISNLRYGSNADLGLMRALAVAFFLQNQPELNEVNFRVYSAAQVILPSGQLASTPNRKADKARRRIELRFTNLGSE
jgi:flagellar motor protein MotB